MAEANAAELFRYVLWEIAYSPPSHTSILMDIRTSRLAQYVQIGVICPHYVPPLALQSVRRKSWPYFFIKELILFHNCLAFILQFP